MQSRTQSIQRLQISLAELGYAKNSSFTCLSQVGSYSVFGHSLESSESNIYGIFYGDRGLNLEKFVNKIWKNFGNGSKQIPASFAGHKQILTVVKQAESEQEKFAIT